jgi:hypothetical protein
MRQTMVIIAAMLLCASFIPVVAATQYYLYTYIVPYQPVPPGNIALNPPGGVYATNTSVTLTATASAGYQFSHWDGSVTGTTNPVVLVMTTDMMVTAYFVPINPQFFVTLHVMPVPSFGSIALNPNQQYYYNQNVLFTA